MQRSRLTKCVYFVSLRPVVKQMKYIPLDQVEDVWYWWWQDGK
jgi:hypothetical protein